MRKGYPVIAKGEISFSETGADKILAYQRELKGQKIVVFCNLDGKKQSVKTDGEWKGYKVLLENYPLPAQGAPSRGGKDEGIPLRSLEWEKGQEASEGKIYTMEPYEFMALGNVKG